MLYNESDETNICNIHKKEGASRKYYIHHSSFIYNQFKKLNLCKFYSNRVINHLMSILSSIFISGYHGKTTNFAKTAPATELRSLISLIPGNGMIHYFQMH